MDSSKKSTQLCRQQLEGPVALQPCPASPTPTPMSRDICSSRGKGKRRRQTGRNITCCLSLEFTKRTTQNPITEGFPYQAMGTLTAPKAKHTLLHTQSPTLLLPTPFFSFATCELPNISMKQLLEETQNL